MNNGDKTAYPTPRPIDEMTPNTGLTKREYFAALAPNEIPGWFKVSSKIKKPIPPKSWIDFSDDDPNKELLKDWQHDPCYDLPPELSWYQVAWEKHRADINYYDTIIQSERFFAWRLFYADELLKQFNG